jgi:opacity protein-like surface antigen
VFGEPRLANSGKGERRNIMKNFFILLLMVVALCFSKTTYGQDSSSRGAYIGIGGSYACDDFEMDDIEEAIRPLKVDFDEARGINLKFGYHVNDFFCMEGIFDSLPGFETDETWTGSLTVDSLTSDGTLNASGDIDIMTFMAAAKLHVPSDILQPFCVLGVGLMHAKVDAELQESAPDIGHFLSISDSDSDVQSCAKVGAGVDLFVTRNVSVGVEGSYVFAFGDFKFQSNAFNVEQPKIDFRYWNLAVGLAYHF